MSAVVFCSCRFDSCRVNCCTPKNPTIQNNSVRFIKNKKNKKLTLVFRKSTPQNDYVTPLSFELHWLTVQFRVKLKLTSLSTASNNNFLLPYLSSILNIFHPSHSLRSSNEEIPTVARSIAETFGQRSFNCQTVLVWNLPTARFATQLFFLCLRQAKILSLLKKLSVETIQPPTIQPPSPPLKLLLNMLNCFCVCVHNC